MRRFDKKHNIERANLLAEQRYLESKSLINENIDNIETFKAGDKVSFDDYRKNPIKQYGVIIGKLDDKSISPNSPQFFYSVQLPSGEKVPVRNISLTLIKRADNPIDEISGELKRSAFNIASDRLSKTQDWDVDSKEKYGDIQKAAMSHVNPEIKKEIENVGKKFGFNTFIEKRVGGLNEEPVLQIFFGESDKVNKTNYLFSYTILVDKYSYYSLKTDYVKPPELGRIMLKLIEKIQKEELRYSSK